MSFSFPTKQPQPHKLRLFVQSHRLRNVMTDRLINSSASIVLSDRACHLDTPLPAKNLNRTSLDYLFTRAAHSPPLRPTLLPRFNRSAIKSTATGSGPHRRRQEMVYFTKIRKIFRKTARRAKTVPQHPTESTWHRHTFRSDTPLPAPPCRRSSHSRNRQRPPPSSTAWSMAAGNWIPSHRPR